jgi:hypothetical protein
MELKRTVEDGPYYPSYYIMSTSRRTATATMFQKLLHMYLGLSGGVSFYRSPSTAFDLSLSANGSVPVFFSGNVDARTLVWNTFLMLGQYYPCHVVYFMVIHDRSVMEGEDCRKERSRSFLVLTTGYTHTHRNCPICQNFMSAAAVSQTSFCAVCVLCRCRAHVALGSLVLGPDCFGAGTFALLPPLSRLCRLVDRLLYAPVLSSVFRPIFVY